VREASIRQMATRISIANIARVSVGVVVTVWAALGLGDALAAATARGIDPFVALEIAVNAVLAGAAVMAFAGSRRWRAANMLAMVAVTLVRLYSVLGTGDYLLGAASIAMLAAVVGIAVVAKTG
jgi:hypothetical protein